MCRWGMATCGPGRGDAIKTFPLPFVLCWWLCTACHHHTDTTRKVWTFSQNCWCVPMISVHRVTMVIKSDIFLSYKTFLTNRFTNYILKNFIVFFHRLYSVDLHEQNVIMIWLCFRDLYKCTRYTVWGDRLPVKISAGLSQNEDHTMADKSGKHNS